MEMKMRGGMGFLGWLTIMFVGLKLTGFIDWSWWWVLAPFWAPFLVLGVFALIILLLEVWVGE